jgi:hypothetical protein
MTVGGSRFTVLLAAVLGVLPGVAVAQTRSVIVGTVTDSSQGALPGVTITVSSPAMVGGALSTTTGSEGSYVVRDLSPGVYEVVAELSGFKTVRRQGIQLSFATTLTVDVLLEVGPMSETVTVVGDPPTVDVTTAAAATSLDGKLVENVPTARATMTALVDLLPGVTSGVAYGNSRTQNTYMYDGILGTSPDTGAVTPGMNYNWISEIQYVALGASAEYGETQGATINLILKSGSNRYAGLLDYWTTRPGWVSDNRSGLTPAQQQRFRPQEILSWWDTSAQIGGPVLRDRLFFFAGYQYYRDDRLPSGSLGGSTDTRIARYRGKIDWSVVAPLRVEAEVNVTRFDFETGHGPTTLVEALGLASDPIIPWGVRTTWTANSSTFFEFRLGGFESDSTRLPLQGALDGPAPRRDLVTGIRSENYPSFNRLERPRRNVGGYVTRHVEGLWGRSHTLKGGLEFERTRTRREDGYPGKQSFQDQLGQPFLVELWEGSTVEGVAKRFTAFVQDVWTIREGITIEPGVRFSTYRGSTADRGTVFSTQALSPRIGLAWELGRDHKTVLRAHYGHYHDGIYVQSFSFLNTAGLNPIITARVDGPNRFTEINRSTLPSNFAIDDDLVHPYTEQFLVGVERELFPQFSLQAQFIRRNFENNLGFIDTGSIYDPVQRQDPGPDGRLNTGDDGTMLTVYNLRNPGRAFSVLTNPDGAYRRYTALQFIGRKRYADNWQVVASYTWSRSEGTVDNQFGGHIASGASDTGTRGAFANPNQAINNEGRSTFDYPHQVKIEGSYLLPLLGGFHTGVVYRYFTGEAWGRRAIITGLSQGTETIRIETRGTRRMPDTSTIDLHVEKLIPLRGVNRAVGVYLDIFNVTNDGAPVGLRGLYTDVSGSSFGVPNSWSDPRLLRAGLRLEF